jgi:hypothetical protein
VAKKLFGVRSTKTGILVVPAYAGPALIAQALKQRDALRKSGDTGGGGDTDEVRTARQRAEAHKRVQKIEASLRRTEKK